MKKNKIIITGALGHIGSYLIEKIFNDFSTYEIILVDNLRTQRYSSLFYLSKKVKCRFIEEDTRSPNFINVVEDGDVVIHLAAITDAANSFNNAEEIEKNNLAGTQNVITACVEKNAKLIFISSTSVYGTQSDKVSEDCARSELKPQSPYAEMKLKEEDLVLSSRGLRAVICRFGTIFGVSPGMRFHTAVNKFCWQAAYGHSLTIWEGAYHQKRPYLALEDAYQAINLIIKKNIFNNQIYNVLTSNLTVHQVVQPIKKFITNVNINFVSHKIMNQLSYEVSYQKFEALGFIPTGFLERDVKSTIELLAPSSAAIG